MKTSSFATFASWLLLTCGLGCGGRTDPVDLPAGSASPHPGQSASGSTDMASTGSGSGGTAGSTGSGAAGAGSSGTGPSGAGSTGTASPCPSTTAAPFGTTKVTITFSGLGTDFNQPYTEAGFTISPTSGNWIPSSYGNPSPSIDFVSPSGGSATGEILVTAGGATFHFETVDLYSSVTTIPYTFVGVRNCTTVFTETGTVPHTFGNFQTVATANSAVIIDTLTITLTDPALPGGGRNPMGLDNLVLSP